VQGHDRTCCAYHLQLAGLNARAHAAAVLVKSGDSLVVNSGEEGVILVLKLVNNGKKPIDKDRAARTRFIFKISLARNARLPFQTRIQIFKILLARNGQQEGGACI
jgi:hypothetical protein